ncbi:MAG: M56 family metallopeptidase [Saprospiraceae bacterium]|nr:M56 family metallopeptidase [Saprospiraceae bacterium]
MFEDVFLLPGQNTKDALGMVFLHSLWQFTFIAAIASWCLKKNIIKTPSARYFFSWSSLFIMVITASLTFGFYYDFSGNENTNVVSTISTTVSPVFSRNLVVPQVTFFQDFELFRNWLLLLWISGIIFFTFKLFGSLLYLEWLKKKAIIPGSESVLMKLWNEYKHTGKVNKNIKLKLSDYISSPLIIGQLKPVILFPVSLVTQLNAFEIECIIAHELAHYKRYDWWANLLQTIVEVIFYYHPAVYYISKLIREERESCCDECAIQHIGGQHLTYAKTLVKLQEWENQPYKTPALAFVGNKSFFVDRIKKILNMNAKKNVKSENILIGLIILSSLFFVSKDTIARQWNQNSTQDYLSGLFDFVDNTSNVLSSDSIPVRKESVTIIKKENDKEVKLEMENGKIVDMEIDGKKIEPENYDKYPEVTKDIQIHSFGNDGGVKKDIRIYSFGDRDFEFDFPSDTFFRNFSFEDIAGNRVFGDNVKKHMEMLRDQLKNKNFEFYHFDSLMDAPDNKAFRFHFHKDFPGMDGEKSFEFNFPDNVAPFEDFEFETAPQRHPANVNDVLGNQLNKDGLLIPNKENKVELTGKTLKINGEKQPSNIWNKYKRIFEETTGTSLEKKSRISFHFWGKEAKRKYKAF